MGLRDRDGNTFSYFVISKKTLATLPSRTICSQKVKLMSFKFHVKNMTRLWILERSQSMMVTQKNLDHFHQVGCVWYVGRDGTERDEAFRPAFGTPKMGGTGCSTGQILGVFASHLPPLERVCSTSVEHTVLPF